ncbi:hypothetical protein [Clostridium tetani]|uniref:hypothetical protein n=1 Tax=Clostridium tetani TaxID=1513 RepID=UPI002954E37A|nr:hypothetical protein [Clostridium tetani]
MSKILNYLIAISVIVIILLWCRLTYLKKEKAKLEIEKLEVKKKKDDKNGKE